MLRGIAWCAADDLRPEEPVGVLLRMLLKRAAAAEPCSERQDACRRLRHSKRSRTLSTPSETPGNASSKTP